MDFNDLLDMMTTHKASDLFISADVEPSMKINGEIVAVGKTKLNGEIIVKLIHAIMSEKQRQEFAETRECNFASVTVIRARAFVSVLFSSANYLVWFYVVLKPKFQVLRN